MHRISSPAIACADGQEARVWIGKDEFAAAAGRVGVDPKLAGALWGELRMTDAHAQQKTDFSGVVCVQVGERVEVEVDQGPDEGPEDLVWATATVCSIDADGQFNVLVDEWDALPVDNPLYEEAYEEGPYAADGENSWWRRQLLLPTPLPDAPSFNRGSIELSGGEVMARRLTEGATRLPDHRARELHLEAAWWRQDHAIVELIVQLPKETSFKRHVELELSDGGLSLKLFGEAALEGQWCHAVDAGASEYDIDDAPPGFEAVGAAARFLTIRICKSTPGLNWQSLLAAGASRPSQVTIERDDGVKVTVPDGARAQTTPQSDQTSLMTSEGVSSPASAGRDTGSSGNAAANRDVKVTIRVKKKANF